MKDIRIVFMGTPEIAVESLEHILKHQFTVVSVVTSVDKPAGRGLKVHESAVKLFTVKNNIPVLQPENLSDSTFVEQIKNLNPDMIIVVAFRKVPDEVLSIPKLGSFNLHASLLPQYRGAAPINWAIINGETKTGMTTFLLNNRIDAGDILLQKTIEIPENWNASKLHDRMKVVGADMVIETIKILVEGNYKPINQEGLSIASGILHKAPKIFHEHCRIDWWNKSARDIQNLIRGLSLKPGAFTELISTEGTIYTLKILSSDYVENASAILPGTIETDKRKFIKIYTRDGFINLKEVQVSGKKVMKVEELLRGFKLNSEWKLR